MGNLRVFSNVLKLNLIPCRIERIVTFRQYSQYPTYYISPVYKKDKLKELHESGEIEKLSVMPVKAALNDETCSVFHDPEVTKFINYVMRKGKKALARELVGKAFENIKRIQITKYNKAESPEAKANIVINPTEVFHSAVKNATPIMQLTRIVRGGAAYQVPVPITDKRARFLAMNWLIEASQDKDDDVRFHTQLAKELLDAGANIGRVVKRKQDLHKQCEANRAYAHYRWA